MITTPEKVQTIYGSEQFTEYAFGIDANSMPVILDLLRNALYSDKILAVIREYACNAHDANVEAGRGEVPIRLTMPTDVDPTFRCRDFGSGLSEDDVARIYTQYGKSTKRNTNRQVGFMGIGSKSGFAYGDSFVVISYFGGKKTTYNCYIDPSQEGRAAKLHEELTEEPTGIEVLIPVRSGDVPIFHKKTADFLQFWKVKPEVRTLQVTSLPRSMALEGTFWHYEERNTSVVVMGNIPYPLATTELTNQLTPEEQELIRQGLVIRVQLGEVQVAASREALQYTDATRKALVQRIQRLQKEVTQQLEDRIQNAETLWEAKCLVGYISKSKSIPECVRNLVRSGIYWKGKLVNGIEYPILVQYKTQVKLVGTYRDATKQAGIARCEVDSIEAGKDVQLFVNDTRVGSWSGQRMRTLFSQSTVNRAYILTFPTPEVQAAFFQEHDFEGAPFAPLSSVAKAPPISALRTRSTGQPANPKHTAQVFLFKPVNTKNLSRLSDAWETVSVDLSEDEGIYIPIHGFVAQHPDGRSFIPNELVKILKTAALVGIQLPELIGVKPEVLPRFQAVEETWTSLWDFLRESLQQILADPEEARKVSDLQEYQKAEGLFKQFTSIRRGFTVPDSLMGHYLKALAIMRVPKDKAAYYLDFITLLQLGNFLELLPAPSYQLQPLLEQVWQTYPMLQQLAHKNHQFTVTLTDTPSNRQVWTDYINLVDAPGLSVANQPTLGEMSV